MGRKGRPRNALVERKPSGDAKPIERTISPAVWGRLKAIQDPLLCSEIGRLVYEGHLTRAQAEVGWRIGETYQRWHRSQRLRASPKSANLEAGFPGGADVAEERLTPDEIEVLETEAQRIQANFQAVDAEIRACPENLRSAILDVCVYSIPTNWAMYPDVRRFLTRMGHFFTTGRRRGKKADLAQQLGGFAQQKAPETHAPAAVTHIRRGDPVRLAARITHERVVRRILPQLSDDEVKDIMGIFIALCDREESRLRKTARSP